jgi:hypothetical protein
MAQPLERTALESPTIPGSSAPGDQVHSTPAPEQLRILRVADAQNAAGAAQHLSPMEITDPASHQGSGLTTTLEVGAAAGGVPGAVAGGLVGRVIGGASEWVVNAALKIAGASMGAQIPAEAPAAAAAVMGPADYMTAVGIGAGGAAGALVGAGAAGAGYMMYKVLEDIPNHPERAPDLSSIT